MLRPQRITWLNLFLALGLISVGTSAHGQNLTLNVPTQTVGAFDFRIVDSAGGASWTTGHTASIMLMSTGPPDHYVAIDTGSYRPNPASFDPSNVNSANPDGQYANASTAPAVFGGRVQASPTGSNIWSDVAFFAIRDVDILLHPLGPPINDLFELSGSLDFDSTTSSYGDQLGESAFAAGLFSVLAYNSFTNTYTLSTNLVLPPPPLLTFGMEGSSELELPAVVVLEGSLLIRLIPEPSAFTLCLAALMVACEAAWRGAYRRR